MYIPIYKKCMRSFLFITLYASLTDMTCTNPKFRHVLCKCHVFILTDTAYKRQLKIHTVQVKYNAVIVSFTKNFFFVLFCFLGFLIFLFCYTFPLHLNGTMLFSSKVWWRTSGLAGAEHWMIIFNIKVGGIKWESYFYSSRCSKYCSLSFLTQVFKQYLEKYISC